KPASSLTRPLSILIEMDLIHHEIPFGTSIRDTKRTLYKISDPFLKFWLTFIEPNRSLLETGLSEHVLQSIKKTWPNYIGNVWEELSRKSVTRLSVAGKHFGPAFRWWGKGNNGAMLEFDIVSQSLDNHNNILIGEAKHTCRVSELPKLLSELAAKASQCPLFNGKELTFALWIMNSPSSKHKEVFDAEDVVSAMK
ncbi:MAG: hypothetical protein JNL74_04890, partial [Fibrobacteres bacterium]|nr:hypothetical protein [Fibrobacterota bacterium]